jgi:CubicO group peptidase (beta-lactamase class C family)
MPESWHVAVQSALAVYRGGEIVYKKGYGLANIEGKVSITPHSVFDIGSTSKQFTAATILLLQQQRELSVVDDVGKYIPELPDYGGKITILDLLHHTSGLRDYLELMNLAGISLDGVTTDEDALQIVARQKALNFAPGSDWLYSNTGYFLLSVIVKRVSGKTLRRFAAENIFAPLRMTRTQFRDDHTALIRDRALAYDSNEKGGGYTLNVSYFEQTGDGAVHTSVEDMQKWDENFYSGQVGGRTFLAEIQERGKLSSGKVLDYAKGLFIAEYRGLPTVSHGGSWGGYRAELLRFPEQHFSVACFCNRGDADAWRMARAVADVYLAGLMQPAENTAAADGGPGEATPTPPESNAAELSAYAGDYASDELGVSFRLAMVESRLKLVAVLDPAGFKRSGGLPLNELRPAPAGEFALDGTQVTLRFTHDATRAVTGFMLDAERARGMVFTRDAAAGK